MYLTQGLHRSLQQHAQRLALRDLAEPDSPGLDFAGLLPRVGRLAAALQAQGVGPGDRVMLLSPNTALLVQQLLACWWLGAVAVPLSTRWAEADLRAAVADLAPRLLVVDPSMAWVSSQAGLASALPADAGEIDSLTLAGRAAGLQALADSRTGGDALALVLYTSGATGHPKPVRLSQANLCSAALAQAAGHHPASAAVSLLVAPLCHVGALGRLVLQTMLGGTCLTLPHFRADAVVAAIAGHGVTDLMLAPSMLAGLLDDKHFEPARLQGLRCIAHGAAPMPPALLQRAREAWPAADLIAVYGLTETGGGICQQVHARPSEAGTEAAWRGGPGGVGPAGAATELRIVDAQGLDLDAGRVGEILARGPMVTSGYWGRPEASAAALQDGWLHTGDAGQLDDQGRLTFVERLLDLVVSGGVKIYPAEVEAVLRQHPAVADVAVVGLPHPVWGQAVHAVVVLARGALPQPEALRRHCRRHLAGYKCPRGVTFAGSLPMSATGKVLKLQLRESLTAAQVRRPAPGQGSA